MSDNLNRIGIRGSIAARTPDYRYTLPEGGNPGDIPVKTETGVEWQQPEPATTTPDYNQNDETASDYIKNRPCYINELPTVYSMLYKISDDIPESLLDSSKNLYMAVTDGLNTQRGLAQRIQQNDTIALAYQVIVIIALSDGTTFTDGDITITFPTRGVYFSKLSGDMDVYVSEISASEDGGNSILSWDGVTAKIKMLDHRMIGNPDWNESDETARGYIKNRIVYIGDEYAASFESDSESINVGSDYVAYAGDMVPFIANRTYHIVGSISGCIMSSGGKDFVPVNIDMIVSCMKDSYLPIEVSSYPVNGYYYILRGIYDKSRSLHKGDIELSNAKGISDSFALKISLTITEIKQLDSLLLPTITADKLADGVLPSASKLLPTVTASDSGKFLRVSESGAWAAEETAIPTQVQSDWDQNDSTASDYVKNRPCYKIEELTWGEEQSVTVTNELSLTGNEFIMPAKIKGTCDGTSFEFKKVMNTALGAAFWGFKEYNAGTSDIYFLQTATRDSTSITVRNDGASHAVTYQVATASVTYKQIDEKYIPNPLPTVYAFNAGSFLRVNEAGKWAIEESLILNSSTPDSTKKFKITVDDFGTISATEVTE